MTPALVAVGADDPLCDEGLGYAQALQAAGVAVQTRCLAGPTGWPWALSRLSSLQAPWVAELRPALQAFLAEGLACCPTVRRPARGAGRPEPEAGPSAA
nr:alpha/beta hydrolase fold domain-containing protein [Ideonella sp. B508-1]